MPLLLKDIKRDLKKFRDIKYYSKKAIKITHLVVHPALNIQTLTFQAKVHGQMGDYLAQIRFHEVDFTDEGDMSAKLRSGREVTYFAPHIDANPVSINCSCQDSQFCFEWEMFKEDSCIGTWRKYKPNPIGGVYTAHHPQGGAYKRKTPDPYKGGREFKNPDGYVGYCKHINAFLGLLVKKGHLLAR